jgi:succinate dehydrogenase flavin-adding protein (antitoxin of CptAB toxin-antitoxin module)
VPAWIAGTGSGFGKISGYSFQKFVAAQIVIFKRLLDYPDNDLWDFAAGKRAPPDAESASIIKLFE